MIERDSVESGLEPLQDIRELQHEDEAVGPSLRQ